MTSGYLAVTSSTFLLNDVDCQGGTTMSLCEGRVEMCYSGALGTLTSDSVC